ncbi:response regulator transcription factor [Novosphingobium guangzhouense]|uniref:Uncharacterized protein n=1 Tax=Novosphingobium guangzhouense TaxID=1850347 RepID=A0A2K2G3G3_9SPHN|nr:LuxR C-terminal-related transcriptional regulator [Novosphingobium guangzhouense]PNU05580.1 hypothetical protein A8V01_15580 [Novosphingobium guangzhouense]
MIHPTSEPLRTDDGARKGTVLFVGHGGAEFSQLHALFSEEGYIVEAFACAEGLLDAPLPEGPCCVIVEVQGPANGKIPAGGLGLIERLKSRGEPIPVIFVADDADVPLSVRAIKAGAVDFLLCPYDETDLLNAVEYALELDIERRLIARRNRAMTQRYGTLTRRERQVMDGVVRGLMNKQIAWELAISEITVKLHRSSLMRKMELRSVPDLVRASISITDVKCFPAVLAGHQLGATSLG